MPQYPRASPGEIRNVGQDNNAVVPDSPIRVGKNERTSERSPERKTTALTNGKLREQLPRWRESRSLSTPCPSVMTIMNRDEHDHLGSTTLKISLLRRPFVYLLFLHETGAAATDVPPLTLASGQTVMA